MSKRINENVEHSFTLSFVNLKSRVINLTGTIDGKAFRKFDMAMTELERLNKEPIIIRINSGGGSATDALAMLGRMENSECHLTTEGYGQVNSAATILLAAGDTRRISKHAWFMHHEDSDEFEGTMSSIKKQLKQGLRGEARWNHTMAELTKKDYNFWAKTGVGEDVYFTPDELLEMGVVDEVF